VVRGFRLRICIEDEKELQILGCGWRIVTCQFRGNKVLLRHNGSIATMKRKAFKELRRPHDEAKLEEAVASRTQGPSVLTSPPKALTSC
jgi:hypothetical protein